MTPREVLGGTFRSLRIRNYRVFFWSQLVSLTGAWTQTVAQSWLVLTLTGSGVALGVTTALQFLPTTLLGLWGGLVADRFDKRKVLLATQGSAGVLALALGVLTATGAVRLWMVYLLALLLGLVQVVDGPTRQAFVTEMVGARDVANAVGLNSAVFNAARIVGPAIAAALIVGVDIAWAFVLNGVSYLAVIGGLLAMDPAALHRRRPVGRARGQLREALSFAWRMPDLRATLVTVAVVATWGLNLSVVVPMLATFTFDGDATDYAILSSIAAVGALLGALATAGRARPTHRLLYGTAATFGVFGILAALAPTLMSAAALLLVAAAAAMSFIATANATIQLRTPDALRGRVMALYMLVFLGGSPVGAPVIGWIGERFGARAGLAFGAAVSLAAALVGLAVHERARRARSHALEPVASEA